MLFSFLYKYSCYYESWGMTGASPVTTIQRRTTTWQSHIDPCIVVTGLAPVMPRNPLYKTG
ncbi:MAG: hypothetical protein NVS4B11_20930 [Ktedonobacteraceae bacterium]